ncbi:Bacterial membrane flanked domain [Arthrobacter agilis]|uniref:PH domain-containing protein n=1 Tax=Arthrobacter agilis TaxID=37921 RepID=UPI000F709BE5|nr:Bacterial membrane flanked domain [Arthrobacter agilis]
MTGSVPAEAAPGPGRHGQPEPSDAGGENRIEVRPGEDWRRVHVISPLVRGWIALVAILYFVGRDWFEGLFDPGSDGRGPLPEGVGLLVAVGVVLGVVLLIAGAFLVSWYFTRYQVTAEHVRVHSGVLFRQQRQARLDRVQAIDIVQPFLARIFGLAELKFEVADAGESAVRLAFLKLDDARQLRATILARAAGVETDPEHPEEIIEAPEREVVAIPPGRVIGAALLSGTTIALVVASAAIITLGVVFETPIIATSFIPVLIGVVGSYWSALSTGYNFRAATSPDGIRMRYGLLDTRSQTVPPGRVQAISISQPPLWRLKGWYRVTVNVAGYGVSASSDGQARSSLLPVGSREDVLQILALVLPDPGTPRPVEVFAAGMTGRDGAEGYVTTPRRARLLAPLAWRRNGFAVTETALLVRSGVLWRQLAVVPHERTQSLSIHQGPVDRRFGVADLQFQTTPGPVSPRVLLAETGTAWDLFHGQSVRAAEARRRSGPEQWMKPVPGPAAPSDAQAASEPEALPASHGGLPVPPGEPDAQLGGLPGGAPAAVPGDLPEAPRREPAVPAPTDSGPRTVMPEAPRWEPAAPEGEEGYGHR